MTSGLTIDDVSLSYDGLPLLDRVRLQVAPDEVVCLLGPSGSGKSSLLQIVAGLLPPDAGTVRWDGVDQAGVPPHRRGIGLVFQSALLFPHLGVADNVGYALRFGELPPAARRDRVTELLALVDLEGFDDRSISTLSGGEAQRVALARALAPRPRLLLLDEPFGALDRELRDRLAHDVRSLLHRLGTPAVHVTHDLTEAELVGDRIVRLAELMGGGARPV